MLIWDVSDETADKGVNLHGDVTDLCALSIIFIAEANDLAVIVDDPLLGHDGPFCITTDVLDTETSIKQRGPNISVPG